MPKKRKFPQIHDIIILPFDYVTYAKVLEINRKGQAIIITCDENGNPLADAKPEQWNFTDGNDWQTVK